MQDCNCKYKECVRDITSLGGSIIYDAIKQLYELNKKKNLSSEDKAFMRTLNLIASVVNDTIHPAHDIWLELDPASEKFINHCIDNQKEALKIGMMQKNCSCRLCKQLKNTN